MSSSESGGVPGCLIRGGGHRAAEVRAIELELHAGDADIVGSRRGYVDSALDGLSGCRGRDGDCRRRGIRCGGDACCQAGDVGSGQSLRVDANFVERSTEEGAIEGVRKGTHVKGRAVAGGGRLNGQSGTKSAIDVKGNGLTDGDDDGDVMPFTIVNWLDVIGQTVPVGTLVGAPELHADGTVWIRLQQVAGFRACRIVLREYGFGADAGGLDPGGKGETRGQI